MKCAVTLLVVFLLLAPSALLYAEDTTDSPGAENSASTEGSTIVPHVNVMDFGAHPDREDNTSQIQAAINTGKKAVVPPGNFSVNGTLDIGSNEFLHLAHGAWLRREAGRTNNTEPVVRLTGNFSRLTGEGAGCGVSSGNSSGGHTGDQIINNGVVNVGPASADRYTNINWWVVDSLCISGSGAAWNAYQKKPYPEEVHKNELLTLVCSAPLSAGRGSCYNGRVSNCLFRLGGVAIKANRTCNGNMFTNNHFYRITDSCYFSEGTTENLLTNCFVHFAPGATVIRFRDTGYNHCYGVMAEPGPTASSGRYSRFCDVSRDSSNNVIIGHGNTGHSYINESASSLIITHAALRHSRAASFGSLSANKVQAETLTAKNITSPGQVETSSEHNDVFLKTFEPSDSPGFHDVLQFTCDSPNQVFMLELSITSGSASTSNHSAAKYIVSGKRGSGESATASVDHIGGNESIQCRPEVTGNVVTIQLKPSYHLHRQFIIRVESKSSGKSTLSAL